MPHWHSSWASWNKDDWDQWLLRDTRVGRDAGLIKRDDVKPGTWPVTWHCHTCNQDVAEGYLERHVESQRHKRWQDHRRHTEELAEKQRRGELPPWMILKEGVEYCTLCRQYVTENHLKTTKHQQRLAYFDATQVPALTCSAPGTWAAAAGSRVTAEVPAGQAIVIRQPDVPPHWGDPTCYEWRAEWGRYYCRVCWKYVDDPHINSEKHQWRMMDPYPYLEERWDLHNLYAQDWTKAVTVPQLPPPSAPGAGGASAATFCEEQQASSNLGAAAEDFKAPITAGNAEEAHAEMEGGPPLLVVTGDACAVPAVEAYSPGVPVERGYLTFSKGDQVYVLYHGTSGDEQGWSYGYIKEGEQQHRGWFLSRCIGPTFRRID